MAVVGNTASAIGDVILIVSGEVILGLTSLTSYLDTVTGETGTRFFIKHFKYSINGVHYSNWIELSDVNLQAVVVTPTDSFLIEYRYERGGTDPTGVLEFVDITLQGVYGSLECGFYYNNSIFKPYFECYDQDVVRWCINVLNKVYERGILPNYIERGEGPDEDEDFISFWKSVGCYLALFVRFARELEVFYGHKEHLAEYLKQRSIILCYNPDLVDLVYIMEHYYEEIRHRGTSQIYKREGDPIKAGTKPIDGELLRLFCVGGDGELIFNLVKDEFLGWNLGNSSPMYRGLTHQIAVNKAWEMTRDVLDLTKYPLLEDTFITNAMEVPSDIYPMFISEVSANTDSGISPSQLPLQGVDITKAIRVTPNLSYEITFWVKQLQADSNFTFGVLGFDSGNNPVNFHQITVPPLDPSTENNFFINKDLIDQDRWYFVRGIIFSIDSPQRFEEVDYTLNLGFGTHLRFKEATTVKIVPVILNSIGTASPGNGIKLWDIKIRPLETPFSTCFLQVRNFIILWVMDGNAGLTIAQKEDLMRRYLLPYNTLFTNIYI